MKIGATAGEVAEVPHALGERLIADGRAERAPSPYDETALTEKERLQTAMTPVGNRDPVPKTSGKRRSRSR